MDGIRKAERTRDKSILCDPENANMPKLCKRKKEKSKKWKTSLDECQSSDVGGVEKSDTAVSTQRREMGIKERKRNDSSLTSSAIVKGKVHCGEKEESLSASNASYVEVSSSSAALKASKKKKSRHQVDASENEVVVHFNTIAEFLTDGCEEQTKSNGKQKKNKRDKHIVFRSPLFVGNDLLESIEENQKISDKQMEASMDVTNQKTNMEVCNLNCKSMENVRETTNHEVAESSVSGNLGDLPRREEESSTENSKKSRKMKEGRNWKEVKGKSAVDVKLPVVEKPTISQSKTALENPKRKKRGTEEDFVAKDSKSSVNSLADTDQPLAEKQLKTKTNKKRKTKADGNHIIPATSLLSESPQGNSSAQLTNKPTGANGSETGGDDEGVSESPKKDRKSWRGADVETVKERNDQMTGSFWLKPAASNAGVPRPNKNLFRRKMKCPVDGCLGRSTRINRHILNCHPELEASEREKLVENMMENPCDFLGAVPSAPVVPVLKRNLRCPVDGCFGKTVRLRRHLIKCHEELTPAERDELWEKVSHNPAKYVLAPTKPSTSESQENTEVTRAKKSSAGIPRPNFKVRSRRKKRNCPVSGCHGAAINMRRHLVDCHSDIADEHEQLLVELVEQRQKERAAKKEALKTEVNIPVPSDSMDCVTSEDEVH